MIMQGRTEAFGFRYVELSPRRRSRRHREGAPPQRHPPRSCPPPISRICCRCRRSNLLSSARRPTWVVLPAPRRTRTARNLSRPTIVAQRTTVQNKKLWAPGTPGAHNTESIGGNAKESNLPIVSRRNNGFEDRGGHRTSSAPIVRRFSNSRREPFLATRLNEQSLKKTF